MTTYGPIIVNSFAIPLSYGIIIKVSLMVFQIYFIASAPVAAHLQNYFIIILFAFLLHST